MNIMSMLNFNFAGVTIIDIALISISPIPVVFAIVKYRSQISQFILRRFWTIQTLGKNVMTALRASWRDEIIPRAQPANSNQGETSEVRPELGRDDIREALIAYIDRESHDLKLDDFGPDEYIGYSCGYGQYKIWLTIWIGPNRNIIATRLMIGNEYRETSGRLKENINKIQWLFPEEAVDCRSFYGNTQGIGVEKHVDLSQQENWHEIFVWVRTNLEKLLYVIRIYDAIQESDTQELDTQESEYDIPF